MVQNSININSIDLSEVRARVAKTLTDGLQLDMSTQDCAKLLRRQVNTKTNLVIMFVDINNSTEFSLSLEDRKFALMVQVFAQEISNIVFGYDGYVFKYEGDAVIILFPAMYDEALACRNALNCSMAILEIVTQVINPAFKSADLPEITVKIGIASGQTLVVVYGRSLVRSHVDIVGSSISIASKITAIAKPNQVLVGEQVYNVLLSSSDSKSFLEKNKLVKVKLDQAKWKYPSRSSAEHRYEVYELLRI
ncbi:MAG: diguanylate cyclase [Nitrososphaeraceae archaeon]|nr:diguanylate cyclase [Nitrososphaeraceae archaeon]